MAFPPGFLDELRSRISLAALVGRRVKLTRRGREYAGLCPFHREKTPSFYVVEDKAFFHCFGCGAHGDAIGFVMRADNLDFLEAVEKLAHEAGLAVPQASREERQEAQQQKTLLEAVAAAGAFYEAQLWGSAGRSARDYLQERGLDADTIRRFRLGWAPGLRAGGDGRTLARALAGACPEALLSAAGLVRRREDGSLVDYFRDRVIFPIGDRAGRTIAFGGRVLGEGQPKYLNSPDSPLFLKGRVLYGWAAARAALARDPAARAIVTEGYMDVIALHRAGFAGAVAPLGTALSEAQLAELWRLAPEPVLCFDGDAAGQRAALRALTRALPLLRPGYSLRFATLPSDEDPDSLVRNGGQTAFEEVLSAARPMVDTLWEAELAAKPHDTPERLAELWHRLMAHVAQIPDRKLQSEYRNVFYRRFDPRPAAGGRRGKSSGACATVGDGSPPPHPYPPSPGRVQREILFRLLLHCPDLVEEVAEELAALALPEPELVALRRAILATAAAHPGLDARAFRQHLLSHGFAAIVEPLLLSSVDARFLVRTVDPISVRKEWTHVISMLTAGDQSGFSGAAQELGSDLSEQTWERFRAELERVQEEQRVRDEDPPAPADPG
ncbi:MAG: DNA primase [Stellaceae bacterium]